MGLDSCVVEESRLEEANEACGSGVIEEECWRQTQRGGRGEAIAQLDGHE